MCWRCVKIKLAMNMYIFQKQKNRFFLLLIFILATACTTGSDHTSQEETENSPTSGTLRLSADDTFQPLLGTTVETFEAIYPNATLALEYLPQEQAVQKLLEGEVDVVIAGRPLTEGERERAMQRGRTPKVNKIASDALVFIAAIGSKDKYLTEAQIKKILSGETQKQLVCDKSSSGNLLYLKGLFQQDTLHNIAAAGSDSAVIDYITTHPEAIGIIGMALVSDYDDPKVKRRLEKVKLLPVQYKDSSGTLLEGYPVQEELITGKYPFIRDIFILNLDGQKNLGTGFANFVVSERGQRIVLKSGLMPFRMPSRDIIIKK